MFKIHNINQSKIDTSKINNFFNAENSDIQIDFTQKTPQETSFEDKTKAIMQKEAQLKNSKLSKQDKEIINLEIANIKNDAKLQYQMSMLEMAHGKEIDKLTRQIDITAKEHDILTMKLFLAKNPKANNEVSKKELAKLNDELSALKKGKTAENPKTFKEKTSKWLKLQYQWSKNSKIITQLIEKKWAPNISKEEKNKIEIECNKLSAENEQIVKEQKKYETKQN